MSRVFAALVRHGDYQQLPDTPSAHQPFALNDHGEIHARKTADIIAKAIREHGWNLVPTVDTSRMLRAWQTAQIIIGILSDMTQSQIDLESFDTLAERGVGSVANLTIKEIEKVVQQDPRFDALPVDWKSNSHFRLPFQGAESLMQAGERVAAHLERRMGELTDSLEADCLKVFVGHGAAFRHAAYHLGILEFDQIAQFSMYHDEPVFLEFSNAAGWRHVAGEWKVRANGTTEID